VDRALRGIAGSQRRGRQQRGAQTGSGGGLNRKKQRSRESQSVEDEITGSRGEHREHRQSQAAGGL
jgi:hypothetical protein